MKHRKTRVTKEQVHLMRDEIKYNKAHKNVVIPGPWTAIATELVVKPELRTTNAMVGPILGIYGDDEMWKEKGWYPITINVTSKKIKRDVEKFGLSGYLAAWEKGINAEEFIKVYGTVVLLRVDADHSCAEDETHRFISCRAKTNRKSIIGFGAIRRAKYIVLEKNTE
jgi:hypothetical protein